MLTGFSCARSRMCALLLLSPRFTCWPTKQNIQMTTITMIIKKTDKRSTAFTLRHIGYFVCMCYTTHAHIKLDTMEKRDQNKAFTHTHMLLSCKENLTLSDFEDERGKGTTILYHIEQTHIFTSNGVSLKRTHNGQRISMYRYLHTLLLHFACDCICASE